MGIHDKTINLLRDVLNNENIPENSKRRIYQHIHSLDDYRLKRLIFDNYRQSSQEEKGLRLSRVGFDLLSLLYDFYEYIIFDDFKITDMVRIDQHTTKPWYYKNIDNHTVVYLLDDNLFIHIRLAGHENFPDLMNGG